MSRITARKAKTAAKTTKTKNSSVPKPTKAAKKTKQMKMTKQVERFYTTVNSFVEEFLQDEDNEVWDVEAFKKMFMENIPKDMNKTPKKAKDPKAPKKAKGAYIFFSTEKEIRQQIKVENPDATPNEIMSLIGALWSSEEYKNYHDQGEHKDKEGNKFDYTDAATKYFDMADEDKSRFETETSTYVPDPEFEAKAAREKKVKRAKSAYMFFCADMREDAKRELNEQFEGRELQTEVTRLLGSWWSEMKDYSDDGNLKDKEGKFDYSDNAQQWLDLAEGDKKRVEVEKAAASDEEEEVEEEEESSKKTVKKKSPLPSFMKNRKTKMSNEKKLTESEPEPESDEEEVGGLVVESEGEDDKESNVGDVITTAVAEAECDDEEELDSEEELDDDTQGCGYTYLRNNKKDAKKQGDTCGREVVGNARCDKHQPRAGTK